MYFHGNGFVNIQRASHVSQRMSTLDNSQICSMSAYEVQYFSEPCSEKKNLSDNNCTLSATPQQSMTRPRIVNINLLFT